MRLATKTARFLLVFGALLATGGWDLFASTQAPDHLSIEDGAAYVMMLDQLEQDAAVAEAGSAPVNYCVGVFPSTPLQESQVSEQLLSELRAHAPANLNAKLVPQAECKNDGGEYQLPTGEPAEVLFARRVSITTNVREEWMAGRACGGLCGEGNMYRVHIAHGRPIVIRLGALLF